MPQFDDLFGESYWLGSWTREPPLGWDDVEAVAPWFARDLVRRLDRAARSRALFDTDPPRSIDPDDERAVSDWLLSQLDDARLYLWRRRRPSGAFAAAAPKPEAPPLLSTLVPERTWIGWEVVDREGRAVVGVSYELTLPDGEVRSGTTDAQGRVHEAGIEQGTCGIRFVPAPM